MPAKRWSTPVLVGFLWVFVGLLGLITPPTHAATGSPYSWGNNADGELGDGTTTNRPTPVAVSGLSGVVAIAGGIEHSLALLSDGTVRAWGANYYGQLGDGTGATQLTPVAVSGLSGVAAIAAGGFHGLAIRGSLSAGIFRPATGMWYLDLTGNGIFDGCVTTSKCLSWGGNAGDAPVLGKW